MNSKSAIGTVCLLGLMLTGGALQAEEPLAASRSALELDKQIDWRKARLIAVQEAGRYKTFDSFARESLNAMYGAESFPGLSPEASALDWLFRREAYRATPVIRIRDKGLRIDFTTNLPNDRRQQILETGRMTPNEFESPFVQQRIDELEPRNTMGTAIRRVRDAQFVAQALDRMLRIVPAPGGGPADLWFTKDDVQACLAPELLAQIGSNPAAAARNGVKPNLSPEQAQTVFVKWARLRAGWLAGNAAEVQESIDQLADCLPTLATPGVYPKASQRAAEARYYRLGKFTWGWMLYFAGLIVSIWALITRWKAPWIMALALLLAAMGFHAYGVGLRWYILDRIPIANMFEAVIGSAWLGVAVGLLLELIYRSRVFLLAAHALGFLALIVGGYIIPGGGTITTIMGILDDLMLRIHTLLIIWSYALIFLGAVIATVYLFGYYAARLGRGGAGSLLPTGPLGAGFVSGSNAFEMRRSRPLAAGGMPGDEGRGVPIWLQQVDWCHLIILNLVFVMLFVGTILGAVWADYSWGRPWGWDPKEVFAMNTWLVYAILIHVRFFVAKKGLWTAWLSVAGCAMMAFNWCFVNFFIVGLHSYA